jgi:hypothetical protein
MGGEMSTFKNPNEMALFALFGGALRHPFAVSKSVMKGLGDIMEGLPLYTHPS